MIENLLVSLPKSGSNWIRYCIEFLSERPTQGYKDRLIPQNKGNLVLRRSHSCNKINNGDRVCLLFRNYKELHLRNPKDFPIDFISKEYFSFLDAVNSKAKKDFMIIYYEDLIKREGIEIIKNLFSFYRIEMVKDWNDFELNQEYHRLQSLKVGNPYFSNQTSSFYLKSSGKIEDKEWNGCAENEFKSKIGEYYSLFERYSL